MPAEDWYLILTIAAIAGVAVCSFLFATALARTRPNKGGEGRKRLSRHIRFTYRSQRGVQTIQHAIIYEIDQRRGRTYIHALCMPNRAPRIFRSDRVIELIDLKTAEKPENIDDWLEKLVARK